MIKTLVYFLFVVYVHMYVVSGDKQNFNEIFKRQLTSSGHMGQVRTVNTSVLWECDSRNHEPTYLSSLFWWFRSVLESVAVMAGFLSCI